MRKWYDIVVLGIPIAKINTKKSEETKGKIVTQNASMCAEIKIESIFWLFISKKDRCTSSLVVEIADVKMANMLIEKKLVLDYNRHKCMRYNSACKMKQYFKYYEYGHILVYYQKSANCKACLGSHKTSECSQDKGQKCLLYNGAHTLWEKRSEYKKKKYLKIEAAKQYTSHLHKTSSKPTFERRESPRKMRPPPRLQ